MGDGERSSLQGTERGRWLGPEATRSRPWAYEELLFGSNADFPGRSELSALAAELASDLAELARMEKDLYEQIVTIARLEGRVQALLSTSEGHGVRNAERSEARPGIRSLPSDPLRSRESAAGRTSLARCEGFRVDSPTDFVGFVEGLRFESRIDEPDLLEVRGGRFGRELALIPIGAVEEISLAEERVLIRGTPKFHDEHPHELVNRLRKALHVMNASLR